MYVLRTYIRASIHIHNYTRTHTHINTDRHTQTYRWKVRDKYSTEDVASKATSKINNTNFEPTTDEFLDIPQDDGIEYKSKQQMYPSIIKQKCKIPTSQQTKCALCVCLLCCVCLCVYILLYVSFCLSVITCEMCQHSMTVLLENYNTCV